MAGIGQNDRMPSYGIFPAEHFIIAPGRSLDGEVAPQIRWYFQDETIAVPHNGWSAAGLLSDLPVWADLAAWNQANPVGGAPHYPPLVWLGAPDVLQHAMLAADGRSISVGTETQAWRLVARLPLNKSWFDASSLAFFGGRPVKIRGNHAADAFVARTVWPEDFRLPEDPVNSALAPEPVAVRDWLRAQPRGGAQSPFAVESVWRRPGLTGPQAGQPVLGLMLNGAQGDDDEAHSGHFALMTGQIGEQGAIDDWLVNNFYTLDSESEKGIIAAPVPLDNYLADLNSGQAWYRPSYMLVATLKEERTAQHLQSAMARIYQQFYRHRLAYQHARANCTGISVTTSRILGWRVPARGAESWLKAVFALPWRTLRELSLSKGKAIFDYLTEDRTRLYPAAAFEEMAADLLKLVSRQAGRPLTVFEHRLAEDVAEILLVRVPQFPSSRAWGDYPVETSVEYRARLPQDPAEQQIIPVPRRVFPDALCDPQAPPPPPLRSDYAAAAWAVAIVVLIVLILGRLLA
jgi:hypothetical protein